MSGYGNYPPGVSASDLPGYNNVDTTTHIECAFAALYVPAHEVWAALDEARKTALDGVSIADALNKMEGDVLTRLARDGGKYERLDTHSCGYVGEADATIDSRTGVGVATCPRCEGEIEIDLGEDWSL